MPLRLLVIEDRASDFELLQGHLQRQEVDASCHRVDTFAALTEALEDGGWDAVVTDYSVPGMGFRESVEILRSRRPELPILLFSGYMGEDQAAELLKSGVTDFVLKYRPARLGSAIRRAVADAREHRARRAAELALRESEERLRLALHGAELGALHFDFAAGIFHLDARAQEQFQLSEGVQHAQMRARILAEDLPQVDAILAQSAAAQSDGRYAMEFRVRHADGEVRWLSSSGRVHCVDGVPKTRIGIVQDVTARKQADAALRASEERLQQALRGLQAAHDRLEKQVAARTAELSQQTNYLHALVDNFPFRLWLKDTEGRFLAVNRAHAVTYGHSPAQIVGKTDFDLVDGELAHERLRRDREVIESRRPTIREASLNNPNQVGWFETYKAPVFDEAGNVLGTIGYSRDITEHKAVESAREEALSSAQHLAALRSEFVANMSHEIRTPLNAVLGLAQIGMRENAGRKARDTFSRILESGQLLLGIVNDVLDFSKIEAGKLNVEQVAFDPRDAIDRAVALTAAAAYGKALEFRLEEAADLPASCVGDILRIAQVLVNLLSNAIKFTEQGWVRLAAARVAQELVLTVEDSGIGMSPDQAERLFQPFEQADGSTTRRFGGTGLGLAITRRLVSIMQGRIRVDSLPDSGTRFEVRLPLDEATPPHSLAGFTFVFVGMPQSELRAAAAMLGSLGAHVEAMSPAAAVAAAADLLVFNGAAVDAVALQAVDAAIEAGRRIAFVRTPGESDIPLGLGRSSIPIVERPLRMRRLLEACKSALEAPAERAETARLNGVRVLAAEDNEVNRLVLQETLLAEGVELTVVNNGRLLLERLLHEGCDAYDVVLTDIQMPQMDGYEAARRIRDLSPDLPVIGLTARAMAEERSRCLAAGMNEHVAKPIDIDLLVALILRHSGARARSRVDVGSAPQESPIDWSGLNARYPHKPAFVRKLLAMTATAYAETPAALRAAARDGDLDALSFLAHGLKGVGGNIAAPALREQARLTEESARQRRSDAAGCAERLAENLERVLVALRAPAGGPTPQSDQREQQEHP